MESQLSETALGALYIRLFPYSKSDPECYHYSIETAMAEATAPITSSIEMSSIPLSRGRHDVGLGGTEIGYDEERAEPNSRACIRRNSNWIRYYYSLRTYLLNNCCADFVYQHTLRRLVNYLHVKFKSSSSTIHLPSQEQPRAFQMLVERSRRPHLLDKRGAITKL